MTAVEDFPFPESRSISMLPGREGDLSFIGGGLPLLNDVLSRFRTVGLGLAVDGGGEARVERADLGSNPFAGSVAEEVTKPPPSELRPAESPPGGLETASSTRAAGLGRPTSELLSAESRARHYLRPF